MVDLHEHERLARYTSWRIGGPARYLAEAATIEELREALAWARARGLRVALLGGGTNTLVLDSGFNGLVLRYRGQELQVKEIGDIGLVTIGAGAPTAGTARRLARQGWGGFEWAEGLPGTIGGAVFGNAGCYGSDMAAILTRAWLLEDDALVEWPAERLAFGYRTSSLKELKRARAQTAEQSALEIGPIVIAAEVRLRRTDPSVLAERMERTAAERRSKTPAGQSCGSVFKNPPGESAGRLIEAAGLKGVSVGGAEIARKHANYIVNRGGATSDDVLRLVEIARERVLHEFGIALELEVQILGDTPNQSGGEIP